MSRTDELYKLRESRLIREEPIDQPPPAPEFTPQMLRKKAWWQMPIWKICVWAFVVIFVAAEARWALRVGLNLRKEIWTSTRSIRYESDVNTAYRLGNGAIREAEHQAGLANYADVEAGRDPQTLADIRKQVRQRGMDDEGTVRLLTRVELLKGLVNYYHTALGQGDDEYGDPYLGLDYPPLRLLAATLWVHHVQATHPLMFDYPRHNRQGNTVIPQDEDIVQPLLNLNTAAEITASIAMFFLVFVWVRKSMQPMNPDNREKMARVWQLNLPDPDESSRWGWFKSLRDFAGGLPAFALATGAFWYCFVGFIHPPPNPTPLVNITKSVVSNDGKSVAIAGTANTEENFTRWHVEWGLTDTYGRVTPTRNFSAGTVDHLLRTTITPTIPGQTIHFRLKALSASGSVTTPDYVVRIPGHPGGLITTQYDLSAVGGVVWPEWNIWLMMLGLFLAMVILARTLPAAHRPWACGLVAAMLVWFDPITLLESHAWPQWDVWILPFFILAVLMATLDWWMVAGILIGIGCMAKGQMLLAGPVLILWPILGGRWGAALRIITGLAIGAGIIVSPWLLNSSAQGWVELNVLAGVVLGAAAVIGWTQGRKIYNEMHFGPRQQILPFSRMPQWRDVGTIVWSSFAGACLAAGVIIAFWSMASVDFSIPVAAAIAMGLAISALVFARRTSGLQVWLGAVLAGSIWLGGLFFRGSWDWWTLGFAYGTRKQDRMQMGEGSFANLPSLLLKRYHWDLHQLVGNLAIDYQLPHGWNILGFTGIHWNQDLDLKTSLVILFGISLVICALGASITARRKDPRLLIAAMAPWLLFPILMCQTSERYLLWPSALSAAFIAVSTGFTLMHVVLALCAAGMLAHQLMFADQGRWPALFNFFTRFYPDAGWMMLLLAILFMVAALMPARRSRPHGGEVCEELL
jgi:hypothetical protein